MTMGRFRIANVVPWSAIAVILIFFNEVLTQTKLDLNELAGGIRAYFFYILVAKMALKFFKSHLLPNNMEETWGQHGDSELLNTFHSDIEGHRLY